MKSDNLAGLYQGYWSSIYELQQRNLEAMLQARQAFMEGATNLGERYMDVLGKLTKATVETAQDILNDSDPLSRIAKSFDALKASAQNGSSSSNLLTELVSRSGAEAAGIIQTRAFAALDEMKAMTINVASNASQEARPSYAPTKDSAGASPLQRDHISDRQ